MMKFALFMKTPVTASSSKMMQVLTGVGSGVAQRKTAPFVPKKDWPFNSPNLNPCDYYLWGRLKNLVSKHRYTTQNGLKRAIKFEFGNLDRSEIQRAYVRIVLKTFRNSCTILENCKLCLGSNKIVNRAIFPTFWVNMVWDYYCQMLLPFLDALTRGLLIPQQEEK